MLSPRFGFAPGWAAVGAGREEELVWTGGVGWEGNPADGVKRARRAVGGRVEFVRFLGKVGSNAG